MRIYLFLLHSKNRQIGIITRHFRIWTIITHRDITIITRIKIPALHGCLLILCAFIHLTNSDSGMRYDFPMKMPGRSPIRINLLTLRTSLMFSFSLTSSVDKKFSLMVFTPYCLETLQGMWFHQSTPSTRLFCSYL